jgi:Tol biopolymer transport system component
MVPVALTGLTPAQDLANTEATLALSDNGVAVFESAASGIVAGDTNGVSDIFLKRTGADARRINLRSNGEPSTAPARQPAISADGNAVVYLSSDSGIDGLTGGNQCVFLYDDASGSNVLVSRASSRSVPNAASASPRISGDGKWVLFQSLASNLVAGDVRGTADLFLWDRTGETLTRLAQEASDGCISHDGRFVVYRQTSGTEQCVLIDRQTGQSRVAPFSDAVPHDVSTDGKAVLFTGRNPGLILQKQQIFIWNPETQAISTVAESNPLGGSHLLLGPPQMAADGSVVTFISAHPRLTAGERNGLPDLGATVDLFVYDTTAAELVRHKLSRVIAAASFPFSDTLGFITAFAPGGGSIGLSFGDHVVAEVRADVRFPKRRIEVLESDRFARLVVTRDGDRSSGLQIPFRTVPLTATADLDFDATSGLVEFRPGARKAEIKIRIRGDHEIEGPEAFGVVLGAEDQLEMLGFHRSAVVQIRDRGSASVTDPGRISLRFEQRTVEEGRAGSAGAGRLILFRDGGKSGASVRYSTFPISAVSGADFPPIDRVATFKEGETSQVIDIPILPDALEEPDERFGIRLSEPGGGARLGNEEATLIIRDTPPVPSVQFALSEVVAQENCGAIRISLVRDKFDVAETVQVRVVSGSAALGSDYAFSASESFGSIEPFPPNPTVYSDMASVFFAEGQAESGILLPIYDSPEVEGAESLVVAITSVSEHSIGKRNTLTVTIVDDEESVEDRLGHGLYLLDDPARHADAIEDFGADFLGTGTTDFHGTFRIQNPSAGRSFPLSVEARAGGVDGVLGSFTDIRPVQGVRNGRTDGGLLYFTFRGTGPSAALRETVHIYLDLYEHTAAGKVLIDSKLVKSYSGRRSLTPFFEVVQLKYTPFPNASGGVPAAAPNSGEVAPDFQPPPVLQSVVVNGPREVSREKVPRYNARVTLSDGQEVMGAINWSVPGGKHSIDGDGKLLLAGVDREEVIIVKARCTFQGQTLATSKAVRVLPVDSLTVEVIGEGSVTNGFAGTTLRTVGRSYELKAKPAGGVLFAGWSGDVLESKRTLRFRMEPQFKIIANFVPNPFTGQSGSYRFAGGNASFNGEGVLTLTESGGISLVVRSQGARFRGKGTLPLNGIFEGALTAPGREPLDVRLTTNFPAGSITIQFPENGLVVPVEREARNLEAIGLEAGRYTLILSPQTVSAASPEGFGRISMDLERSGAYRLTGNLADGTGIAAAGHLLETGSFLIHSSLYNDRGFLTGRGSVTDATAGTMAGELLWRKPADEGDATYPLGFQTTLVVAGTPKPDALPADFVQVSLSGAGLPPFQPLILDRIEPLSFRAEGGSKLRIKRSTGFVQGEIRTTEGTRIPIQGALDTPTSAKGFFIQGSRGGTVSVLLQKGPDLP